MTEVLELIGQYGFPIVYALLLMFYIYKRDESNREDRKQEMEAHHKTVETMTECINRNTEMMGRNNSMIEQVLKYVEGVKQGE